jgi:hypothetical protein
LQRTARRQCCCIFQRCDAAVYLGVRRTSRALHSAVDAGRQHSRYLPRRRGVNNAVRIVNAAGSLTARAATPPRSLRHRWVGGKRLRVPLLSAFAR